jgi:ADP-heptose:LPS heptosyltransferase
MSILIIKMGALGDLIMSTPLIRQIIDHHRSDQVWLLTSPGYARVFQDWPGLQVKALPRKGALVMLQTIMWIRGSRFKRLYDLQSSERTAILSLLSGIPERAGNHSGPAYHYHPVDPYRGQCHAQHRLNQILISAGVKPGLDTPLLPISAGSKDRVISWLDGHHLIEGSFVLMHAGASARHPQKRWPYFLELAIKLKSAGLETLWLGGKEDIDLNRSLSAQTGINSAGLFSVQEEAELGRHARFAVTNDSAPMHILSCSGIPVFGLFGPTDWRRSHAVGQQHNIIALDRDRPVFEPHKLTDISVGHVFDTLTRAQLL